MDACVEMQSSQAFSESLKYTDIREQHFDVLLLPGRHEKGVRKHLESTVSHNRVVNFFAANKPVGAICHGVVFVARSVSPTSERSVIHDYKTTALLRSQDLLAYSLTRLWLNDYYLTYPEITVEDEVRSSLPVRDNFIEGPPPLFRDDSSKLERGFFVRDRNYLSARWPGDAYSFSAELIKMVVDTDTESSIQRRTSIIPRSLGVIQALCTSSPKEYHLGMNSISVFLISVLLLLPALAKSVDETMKRVTIGVSGMMKSKTGIT